MFPLFQVGPYALQVPGLILIVSLWFSLVSAEKEADRQNYRKDIIYTLVFIALITGIISARLWYAGRYLNTFLENPFEIIAINTNTFTPAAGFIIGLMAAVLYGRRKRLPLRLTLDILAPGLALFAVGWGLANLSSGDAFGKLTSLPWAIYLWNENRHPTQVYEIILAAAIFTLLWRYRKNCPFPGFLFLAWISLAASARLFLEAFRGDSVIVAGGIRQGQLAAMGMLLLSLWIMWHWSPKAEHTAVKDGEALVDPGPHEIHRLETLSDRKSDVS